MKKLLENAGLSFEEGGTAYAELWAYARGIELILEVNRDAESRLLLTCEDRDGLSGWADMLGIDKTRYTAGELKSEIRRRLSLMFAFSSYTGADEEFSSVGSGEYALSAEECRVSGIGLDDLKEAGKFLAAYSPFCARRIYSGEGEPVTFDMWDATGYSFNKYDSLGLTWDFLDTIRSDIFEQQQQNG